MKTIRTPKKEKAFLTALSQTCNVQEACSVAGIARNSAYLWRKDDEQFAAKWNEARETGGDALEDEAVRRAKVGVEEPVYYQGAVCGTVRKYSDVLLIFLLKGAKPHKYADRQELSGPEGAPLNFSPPIINVSFSGSK